MNNVRCSEWVYLSSYLLLFNPFFPHSINVKKSVCQTACPGSLTTGVTGGSFSQSIFWSQKKNKNQTILHCAPPQSIPHLNVSVESFVDKGDLANMFQQMIRYIEVEGEKDRKGVCWFAALRLVTKAWENSRQHGLSSPITAASPSFTPGSRRFMRDQRRMHHLTGCASDWLWLASAAFWEAFNQSSNGNVTLTLPPSRVLGCWRLFLH